MQITYVVAFEVKEPESAVYVSPSSYDKTQKHDDMTKREAKDKKDITYSDNEEDVGAAGDFSNLETNINVSPIPTTRVYKDHPINQIIGDLSSAPQTRSMTMMVKEQEKPKRVHQALKDLSWIEAMQEELLQFKMQKRHVDATWAHVADTCAHVADTWHARPGPDPDPTRTRPTDHR
nr:hypothetical protein [Tanacetum cinerariifolium]